MRLGAVGLVHPFPSILVALSAGALGLIAGGTLAQAAWLTLAMAGFQTSIGAINDLRDRDDDAVGQPWKALPSGRVSPRTARWVAATGAVIGVLGSLALAPGTLLVGLAGYGTGVAYDLRLKRTAWGWLCFAIALPLVPVYAWLGVGAGLPFEIWTLFLLGGLAGIQLAIANGLVDAPADGKAGARGIAVSLGPSAARTVMALAAIGVVAVAWTSMLGVGGQGSSRTSEAIALGLGLGSVILAIGVVMSLRHDATWSWRGWQVQAVGVAAVAIVWLAATG